MTFLTFVGVLGQRLLTVSDDWDEGEEIKCGTTRAELDFLRSMKLP